MWLTVLTTFLDGTVKYHAGELRFVDDENAALRFIGRGWAKKSPAPAATPVAAPGEPATLKVHKGTLGVKESKHG